MIWIAIILFLVVGAFILFAAIIFSGRASGHGWLSYVAKLLGGFLTASIIGTLAFYLSLFIYLWVERDIPGASTNEGWIVIALGIAIIIGVIAGVVGFLLTDRYLEKRNRKKPVRNQSSYLLFL